MNIEEALRTYLAAQSSLTDLVSTRIRALKAPIGGAYPQVTYYVVQRPNTHLVSGAEAGTKPVLFQVECWGRTYESSRDVADAIKAVFESGYRGNMGSVYVQAVRVEDDRDDEVTLSDHEEELCPRGASLDLKVI